MASTSDLRVKVNHEYVEAGDIVVGSFTDEGTQTKGSSYGGDSEDMNKRQQSIINDMLSVKGASLFPGQRGEAKATKTKKATKAKSTKPKTEKTMYVGPAESTTKYFSDKYVSPLEEPENTPSDVKVKFFVYLKNQMGKIKMSVLDVLECEMAYALIFEHEDDVVIVPNAGETLVFIDNYGNSTDVYYADTTFTWLDGTKKIMVLFKSQSE